MSEKMNGAFGLIFEEQNAGTIDKYSVIFKDTDICVAFDESKKIPCVSIGDRKSGKMRYYDVVNGELVLADMDEEYCEPTGLHPNQGVLDLGEES